MDAFVLKTANRGKGGFIICRASSISPYIAQGSSRQGLCVAVRCQGKAQARGRMVF